jgi:hypothetical protein
MSALRQRVPLISVLFHLQRGEAPSSERSSRGSNPLHICCDKPILSV